MPHTPLHDAARTGDVAAMWRILAASPGDAMAINADGMVPLHLAARRGRAAALELLLAAAPQAASVADRSGWLPLHLAAFQGDTAAVGLLPSAAPQAASVADGCGCLPLHWAAQRGHEEVVELLLGTAPETKRRRTAFDELALHWAVTYAHLPAARVLVECSTVPPAELIADLLTAVDAPRPRGSLPTLEQRQKTAHALIADLAIGRALSPADWARLPTPCPGLARALPAVLERSPAEAAQLVAHLPAFARGRLRTLALSLARVQRRLGLELPESVVRRILLAAPLEKEEQARCYTMMTQRFRRKRVFRNVVRHLFDPRASLLSSVVYTFCFLVLRWLWRVFAGG
eukprot:scaffold8.g1704.t1